MRNDEDLRNRAIEQQLLNTDYLIEEAVKYKKELMNSNNDATLLKRKLTDQIDGYINLLSHIITEVNGGFQNKIVEQSFCTPKMFNKLLELFNIPYVADILSKDSIIYREVFKSFIYEHPKLFETVHANLVGILDQIEQILGPLQEATDFVPVHQESTPSQPVEAAGVTVKTIQDLDSTYSEEEKLQHLFSLVRNYCSVVRSCSKKIEGFLELEISSTVRRLVYVRRAIIMGGVDRYHLRIKADYEANLESIAEFDKKVQEERKKGKQDEAKDSEDDDEDQKVKDVIGDLSRADYNKKYDLVENCNY